MSHPSREFVEKIGATAKTEFLDLLEMVCFLGDLAKVCWQAIRNPKKIRWRETIYYMDMCGSQALPIVMMICFLMGIILGFQAAVQMRKFGTELYVADLVGFSILKELGPLMVAMIATGRAGSAFAAEIGSMKLDEEINALETMGLAPGRFLVIPKILAMIMTIPLLTIFGDVIGILGGFVVGTTMLGLPAVAYYNRTIEVLTPMVFFLGIIKSLVFAIIIAVVGCLRGFQSECNAQGVGRATTSAVVTSIFFIVIADAVLTILFSVMGY
jgi:phospholipid/cholesterol/gamma-HCH transport system permease protein